MVQRKATQKVGSKAEQKKSHVNKLERQSSSHEQHDARTKGGGDLRKKMKMVRSIKAADLESFGGSPMMKPKTKTKPKPNYMKPTSSSDARKEQQQQQQVSVQSQAATDKKRSMKQHKSLNSSKPSNKSLSRQSSLKPVKPSMKKSSGGALHQKKTVIVNRATCSSTLKDAKFPKALDLNPGATEAEGTSVMKVCPYTYCSLNGHRHEPLPPLKCFMAARRKLLKSQKSMELKRLSSFRVKGFGKDEKEIDTGQDDTHLLKEAANDFFVEIYTKPEEQQIIDHENCDKGSIQTKDDEDKLDIRNELHVVEVDHMNISYSDMSFGDDMDRDSELSEEEMDAVMSFLEHVECDDQVEDDEGEYVASLVPEDYAEYPVVDMLGEESEAMAWSENRVSMTLDAADLDWEEEVHSPFPGTETVCSECSIVQIIEIDCDIKEDDEELPQEVHQELLENGDAYSDATAFDSGCSEGKDGNFDNEEEISEESNIGNALVVEVDQSIGSTKEDISNTSSHQPDKQVFDEPEGSEKGDALTEVNNDESSILELVGVEAHLDSDNESIAEEKSDSSSVSIQFPDSCQEATDADQSMPEEVDNHTISESQFFKSDAEAEDKTNPFEFQNCALDEQSDETDARQNWNKSEEKKQKEISTAKNDTDKTNARMHIIRKKRTVEVEEMKEFNPKAPNFLPVEPDPEAEKVDLRHQMMDERKNAEEWMIDHALQQAVTKLAPARKRKVALLVEAFETVMPLPMWEKPSRHGTSGFSHARIMQACS